MPKISVIVPVYNVEEYLSECLDSILSQSLVDIEIIGIDDCSTDKSVAILNEYASKDKRVKVIHNKRNMGLSYSRNRGLEIASGNYIMFVDSDDMLTEGSLVALYNKAVETKVDGVMFDLDSKNETTINHNNLTEFHPHKYDYTSVYTGQELFTLQTNNNDLQLMAVLCLWKRKFLLSHNLFFREGILHEDNPFSICALMWADRMAFLRRNCYLYRRRDNSITTMIMETRKVIGLIRGNVDIIENIERYDGALEKDFIASVLNFICYVRQLARDKMIKGSLRGEDIKHSHDISFIELLEWKTIIRAGYKHIEGKISLDSIKKLMGCKEIIVYGNGNVGTEIISLLREYGFYNYKVAITKKRNECYNNIKSAYVSSISDLADEHKKNVVIIAVGSKLQQELANNAYRLGFKNVIMAGEL
ncbi:glycosyltransferase family 2 protein [Selenomonas sp. ND2010]|uniref:glycosyltransferase family 2 protein n=1 Tax=Selenomonas sp. ND2010 TaxID=1410618 RepID=UPI00069085F7|nr:glycosyltransferase family 2 protein [Selenomonas sp. ND2010]